MGVSIGKIRMGLLVGGILTVLAVAGFLEYAHLRRNLFRLPSRLGMDVKQDTNGFTYSQSSGGRTIFTIHAAKAIQHKDGKVTLRDVGIVLYGRKAEEADRIYGDEFEYDQTSGEARATGEVRIDLQAPAAAFRGKSEGGIHEDVPVTGEADRRVVHVRTHGLVYQQKLGLATTEGEIEFASGGITGRATGAQYDSHTGVVVLVSDVRLNGLLGKMDKERPAVLTASHAELDRTEDKAVLTGAKYVSLAQGLAADRAVVHTMPDGTPRMVEAAGNVALTGKGDRRVSAARMDVAMNGSGKPESSHLYGGVRYVDQSGGRSFHGGAEEARVSFDSDGRASHVSMTGGVATEERGLAATRTLAANALDLVLLADGRGRSLLREAKALGNAKVRQVGIAAGAKKDTVVTELAGDSLLARFDTAARESRLTGVEGSGHTVLHQVAADGTEETSTGDSLSASFRPVDHTSMTKASDGNQVELRSAIQRGSVHSVRTLPAKVGAGPEIQRASADEETYDADSDHLVLRGRAQIQDAASALYAERVDVDRRTGDASAAGGVRVSYLQVAPARDARGADLEPMHVLADHATMRHDAETALFYGSAGKPARMWQGASRVDAPVLEFVEANKHLTARSDGPANDSAMVHAVLVNAPHETEKAASKRAAETVRVVAAQMIYSDDTRELEFKGAVHVDDGDGVMTADRATVYLLAAKSTALGKANPSDTMMGGQVDRIVATGTVTVQQPGRRANGERLVYTADGKTFLMTGTKASPPRLFDEARGTLAGSSLRFRSGDNSVLVTGGDGMSGPKRVRTDTVVKQ